MKKMNKILLVATLVAATFGLIGRADAQYRAVGDDGIAASPKLRQYFDEKNKSLVPSSTVPSLGYQVTGPDGITASPRLREQLDARKQVSGTPSAVASAGYKATGSDGIAASPKLREQLDSQRQSFMVAPLK